MTIVRTVFQPHVEIDVPDDEAEALRLQGLLHIPPDVQPASASLKSEPRPELVDLPAAQHIAKAPAAKPDLPAADSAPTNQAPPTQKG